MDKIGGYQFKNHQMLSWAFTHRSFSKNNYERLEFLGDSILDFLVAEILYSNNNLSESSLTRKRANIVNENSLSFAFDNLNLQKYVKLGKSCPEVTKAIKCDVFESIVACVYLEAGLDVCKQFIKDNLNFSIEDEKDEKSLFQEYAQKNKLQFEYVLDKTDGPAHHLKFFMSLVVNGKNIASANAHSKIEAEKKCAKIALEIIKENNLTNIF